MFSGAGGSSVARAAIAMFATDAGTWQAATPSGNGGLVLVASLITQDFLQFLRKFFIYPFVFVKIHVINNI